MADITTFFPGGATGTAVPNATNAVNSDQVDYTLHNGTAEADEAGFKFWVGATSDAPSTRDSETLYIFTS